MWLTVVSTPGPYLGPDGIYAPATVTGPVTWSSGAPFADAILTPSVEVWSNASSPAPVSFCLALTVRDAGGAVAGTASGCGAVAGGGASTTWSPSAPIALPGAALWHLVAPPAAPALYTLSVALTVAGAATDAAAVTFGVRALRFDAATGFYLNNVSTKILGMANHQDMAAVGVAVPDHMQAWRILKQKEFGANGWRCAHNPPTPALLDAADALGFLVWDETHRNGNLPLVEKLIRRDRNHPSVVIWSLCNEVLCNTADWIADAHAAKALIRTLDPGGQRVVSANQNGWIGPNTPLDMQGFDYSTGSYDGWHKAAPNIPSISSETSSAVSDRGEYANNETAGHVQAYDNQYPGWGESAEQAWGGVGVTANQGILTRPFISGGWVWTGALRRRARRAARSWRCRRRHTPLLPRGRVRPRRSRLPRRAHALRLARRQLVRRAGEEASGGGARARVRACPCAHAAHTSSSSCRARACFSSPPPQPLWHHRRGGLPERVRARRARAVLLVVGGVALAARPPALFCSHSPPSAPALPQPLLLVCRALPPRHAPRLDLAAELELGQRADARHGRVGVLERGRGGALPQRRLAWQADDDAVWRAWRARRAAAHAHAPRPQPQRARAAASNPLRPPPPPSPQHAEWDKVPTTPGSLYAVATAANGSVVAQQWVNTTGAPAALRISVKDGQYVGGADGTMVARCADAALVQVEVVDAAGAVVPTAADNVTFALTGALVPGVAIAGTSNGDPACLVNSKSAWRPAFHGLVMAVITAGDATGTVTVTASAPGMADVSVDLPVVAADVRALAAYYWCKAAGARM